jgi:transposase
METSPPIGLRESNPRLVSLTQSEHAHPPRHAKGEGPRRMPDPVGVGDDSDPIPAVQVNYSDPEIVPNRSCIPPQEIGGRLVIAAEMGDSDRANDVGARPSAAERPQESGAAALGRGGRMSRQRKTAAVLRLLRGEDLETVSRQFGITAATLTGWHDAFLAAGEAALTTRAATGEELQSDRLKTRLGAVLIERDLLNEKIAILEADRPFARRRRKP